ncbi:S-layer homology domain-containing protein [Vallitalea okinawensis]|uniref:S-layer homology domain-containing protein n=1 Tax=Vallitalea okinawensis TaxID=2078660 RepID=UPI000CFC3409|nr:S-layer homology domain-containing protein [Vallitalea okinawensis]
MIVLQNFYLFLIKKKLVTYALNSVSTLVNAEGINGYPDNTFRPKSPITKAETLTIVDNLIGTYINEPGEYILSDNNQGVVIINNENVTLMDSNTSNNVFITQSVGEGDVELNNSTIEGSVFVEGGGINSIKFIDCNISSVITGKKNSTVRIVADGNTNIKDTNITSSTILDNKSIDGFEYISIDIQVNNSEEIELIGSFSNVLVHSPANIKLGDKTSVSNMTVVSDENTLIHMNESALIASLQLDGQAKITGSGKIKGAVINAENVVIEADINHVTVSKDVTTVPLINGESYKEELVEKNSSAPSGNGGGSNNNDSNDSTNDYDKEEFYSNDYFTLYSSLPLKDDKLPVDSTIIVEVKDGYGILIKNMDLPLEVFEPNYDYYIGTDSEINFLDYYTDYVYSFYIQPKNNATDSTGLKYNTEYTIRFYSMIIVDNYSNEYISFADAITIFTENCTETQDPLALGPISDIKIFFNDDPHLITDNFNSLLLNSFIYSPQNNDINFYTTSSNPDVVQSTIDNYWDYWSFLDLVSYDIGYSTIQITAESSVGSYTDEFVITPLNPPVHFEYIYKLEGPDYIELTLDEDYVTSIQNLEQSISLHEWHTYEEDFIIEEIDTHTYAIYLLDNNGIKMDFDKREDYEIKFSVLYSGKKSNEILNPLIKFKFDPRDYIPNSPITVKQELPVSTSCQNVTLNLNDYFADEDGDRIYYSIDTDSDILNIITVENDIYTIELKANVVTSSTATVTIEANNRYQQKATSYSFIITVTDESTFAIIPSLGVDLLIDQNYCDYWVNAINTYEIDIYLNDKINVAPDDFTLWYDINDDLSILKELNINTNYTYENDHTIVEIELNDDLLDYRGKYAGHDVYVQIGKETSSGIVIESENEYGEKLRSYTGTELLVKDFILPKFDDDATEDYIIDIDDEGNEVQQKDEVVITTTGTTVEYVLVFTEAVALSDNILGQTDFRVEFDNEYLKPGVDYTISIVEGNVVIGIIIPDNAELDDYEGRYYIELSEAQYLTDTTGHNYVEDFEFDFDIEIQD